MKNGANYNKASRRNFIKGLIGTLVVVPFLESCKDKLVKMMVLMRLTGPKHLLGHRLWAKNFPKVSKQIHIPYLIVGGGISGLSAARQLRKKGISDFILLEMEDHTGGNASNGENQYTKFPLGAHYLPMPNMHDKELLQFLEESKIITAYDSMGFPVFDDEQVSFAPEERLFFKNTWQEGLIPKYGNTSHEDHEFQRFFALMDAYRSARGEDGRFLFDIPLSHSSEDVEGRKLDLISMKQWMDDKQFQIQPLWEYVDYCCRDDYGLGAKWVSAWAGIHYFAGRKQNASTDKKDNVMTWPEGNARLASHLKKYAEEKTLKNHLAYDLKIENGKVITKAFVEKSNTSVEIIADRVILASPQFVNQYLLEDRKAITANFHYAPWLLATLVLSDLNDNQTYPLCWDNVIYGAKGLGYINDQHQSLKQINEKTVITYYCSFPADDLRKQRRWMFQKTMAYWKQFVYDDLKAAHPDIEELTEEINIHLLGHGMISPVPGFIFGDAKRKAAANIQGKIFFAHTDLSGISIFEEAFHQGIKAVEEIGHC